MHLLFSEQRAQVLTRTISQGDMALNHQDETDGVINQLSPPLNHCAKHGIMPALEYLLESGCDVNAQDSMGITALMMAIKRGHEQVIERLLYAGSDIFILNKNRQSALHLFLANHTFTPELCNTFFSEFRKNCSSRKEALQILIDAGCHLYQAVYLKDAKILKYMLDNGFSSNATNPFGKETALHVAVMLDDVESVKVLLEHGADVAAVDADGCTPLSYVYRFDSEHNAGKLEILQILLSLGGSPTSCTTKGFFQVQYTLARGSSKAINLVLRSNINFAAKDQFDERSVLHYLAVNNDPEVIQELKFHIDKFDVNVLDKSGVNPLYCATLNGNHGMVEFLLEQGTKPHFANSPISSPLYYAFKKSNGLEKKYEQCAEILLQHDADPQFIINKKNGQQLTIFDIASESSKEVDRVKPLIAQLAVLERRGTSINEITRSKINSQRRLKKYFDKCQRLLGQEISDSMTVFKLLTANKTKMAKYLNRKEVVHKLMRIGHKKQVKSSYSYYYNTVRKYFARSATHKTLRDRAARVVSKLLKDRVDSTNIVTEKVVDYLNDQDLRQLYQFKLENA